MSKASSHQFVGTKGDRIEKGMDPKNLKKQVVAWAEEVIRRMPKDVSHKKRNRFNTACVVFDEKTGKLYFGRNGGIRRFGDQLHPKLEKILPAKSLNKYPTTWGSAETDAINQALYNGSKLKNMRIYVIVTNRGRIGNTKISCENCTYAYRKRIKKNYTGWSEKEQTK